MPIHLDMYKYKYKYKYMYMYMIPKYTGQYTVSRSEIPLLQETNGPSQIHIRTKGSDPANPYPPFSS